MIPFAIVRWMLVYEELSEPVVTILFEIDDLVSRTAKSIIGAGGVIFMYLYSAQLSCFEVNCFDPAGKLRSSILILTILTQNALKK